MTNPRLPITALTPTVLVIALVAAAFAISTKGQPPGKGDESSRTEVVPGVIHTQIHRQRTNSSGGFDRWSINLLDLDPARVTLEVARALDEIVGTETTSSLAGRFGAVAAINGGYFRTIGIARGEPTGVFQLHGKLLSEALGDRAGLAIINESRLTRIAISHIKSRAEVTIASGVSRRIDGINRPREADELILYTPEFHRTTLTTPEGSEAVVRGGRVVSVRRAGSTVIPQNGFVLSGNGKGRIWIEAYLHRGRNVGISTRTTATPRLEFTPEFLIGAGPQLVSAGENVARSEHSSFSQSLINMRHPRTAACVRTDGHILFVTIDGRQEGLSVGMTVEELSAFMIELQCRDAINLDGGGSTTMVIRDAVVNRPSDQAGERAVSDALLIFARAQGR